MLKLILKAILIDFLSVLNRTMFILYVLLFYLFAGAGVGPTFFIVPFVFAFQPFHLEEAGASMLQFAPVSRKALILGRYFYGLLLLLVVVPLSVLTVHLVIAAFGGTSSLVFTLRDAGMMLVLQLLFLGFLFPVFFRFGYRKSQAGVYLVVAVFGLLSAFHGSLPGADAALASLESLPLPFLLIPLMAAILVFGASMGITLASTGAKGR